MLFRSIDRTLEGSGTSHDALGLGLKKAIYNFMHGVGLEDDVRGWFDHLGIAVPKPTVAVLNRAVNAAVNDAEYKAAVTEFGVTLIGGTPEHLMKFLASERAKFADIIRKRNVKVN